jgi:hypothetical protein
MDDLRHQRHTAIQFGLQAPGGGGRATRTCSLTLPSRSGGSAGSAGWWLRAHRFESLLTGAGLLHGLLADLDQARVERPLLGDRRLRLAAHDEIERLQRAPHRAPPVAQDAALARELLRQPGLGPQHHAGEDAHALTPETAICRVVDRGLDHGGVDPPLARAGDLRLLSQQRDPVDAGLQCR